MTIWTLLLSLVHVSFLIAIGRRLTHLNYPGSQIRSVIFMSMGVWAAAAVIGVIFDIRLLTIGAGLPIAIVTALIRHGWLEIRVLLESPTERVHRFDHSRAEEQAHLRNRQDDDRVLGQMVPVKNYVGDDLSILAISDLGKLRDRRIPCRIEGNMVKTLFIAESMVSTAAQVISLDVCVADLIDPEASPPSP